MCQSFCALQRKELICNFVGESLIGEDQVGQTAEGDHFDGVCAFVTGFLQCGKEFFEIDNTFEKVVAESVKTSGTVGFLKVFEVDRFDPVTEQFGEVGRTAVQAAVCGIEVDTDIFGIKLVEEELPLHGGDQEAVPDVFKCDRHFEFFGKRKKFADGLHTLFPDGFIGEHRTAFIPRNPGRSGDDQDGFCADPGGDFEIFAVESKCVLTLCLIIGSEVASPAGAGGEGTQTDAFGSGVGGDFFAFLFGDVDGKSIADGQLHTVETFFF